MDNRYDTSRFERCCGELGIRLGKKQLQDFLTYYEYLTEQNQVMNLTSITEFEEVVLKHFLDSLSIVKEIDLEACGTMIDVGTGAGFPGIPLKIVFPHLKVTLLDSLNKRVRFLNTLIEKLGYADVEAIHGRAEEYARNKAYRETFDLAVSRAVANLSSLSEYCLPFVKVGGKFVSYKSAEADEELAGAQRAVRILGGGTPEKVTFCLPESEIGRSLIVIEKKKGTPEKYPRRAGVPTKEPL